jgi:hypothetical protein
MVNQVKQSTHPGELLHGCLGSWRGNPLRGNKLVEKIERFLIGKRMYCHKKPVLELIALDRFYPVQTILKEI